VVRCFKFEFFLQEFSPDNQFIISADRDFKIRVSYDFHRYIMSSL
jgi:hypothetical protein